MKNRTSPAPSLLASVLAFLLLIVGSAASVAAQTAAAPAAAPAAATPAEGDDGQPKMFGKPFSLNAVEIDLNIDSVTNEVTDLEARYDVEFDMDDISIKSVRLTLDTANSIMRAYGDGPTSRCIVKQGTQIAYCDEFIYYTDTGESEFVGDTEFEIIQEEGNDIIVKGNDVTILTGEEGRKKVRVRRGDGGEKPSISTKERRQRYGRNTAEDVQAPPVNEDPDAPAPNTWDLN